MSSNAEDSYGASGTSCYTTEEKRDSYSTLEKILETKCSDALVRQVIFDMMDVCADITDALRVNLVTVEGSSNVFGDSQLSVDVSRSKVVIITRKGIGGVHTLYIFSWLQYHRDVTTCALKSLIYCSPFLKRSEFSNTSQYSIGDI